MASNIITKLTELEKQIGELKNKSVQLKTQLEGVEEQLSTLGVKKTSDTHAILKKGAHELDVLNDSITELLDEIDELLENEE